MNLARVRKTIWLHGEVGLRQLDAQLHSRLSSVSDGAFVSARHQRHGSLRKRMLVLIDRAHSVLLHLKSYPDQAGFLK